MNTDLIFNSTLPIQISKNITEQLMVCSHERSGTHFIMNTINHISDYCSNPWLNYDLNPLGSSVNFYSQPSVHNFIQNLSQIKIDGDRACNASIIKSHFPVSHLGERAHHLPLKIIYIWRDPAETIASFWKIIHSWGWNEGPKTETPLQLAMTRPSGQSQRYQACNYKDYFERWAEHTIDGILHCESNPKAQIVYYGQLLKEHTRTTVDLCSRLNIKTHRKPSTPSRKHNTIEGGNISISSQDMERLREYCQSRMDEFPLLKNYLKQEQ